MRPKRAKLKSCKYDKMIAQGNPESVRCALGCYLTAPFGAGKVNQSAGTDGGIAVLAHTERLWPAAPRYEG